jgi:hypothetical protein
MPTVAIVDGVRIIFFWNDHDPAHLPAGKLAAVGRWAASRKKELLECWDKTQNSEHPGKVE